MTLYFLCLCKERKTFESFQLEAPRAYKCKQILGLCQRFLQTFNEYVNPPNHAIWNAVVHERSHGLMLNSAGILSAHPFNVLWSHFHDFISEYLLNNEKCILIAHNRKTSGLKWIWCHAKAPGPNLSMPEGFIYFIDPMKTNWLYKSCQLHPSKSKRDSLELGYMWKYITRNILNGTYDSFVDAKAQTEIVGH